MTLLFCGCGAKQDGARANPTAPDTTTKPTTAPTTKPTTVPTTKPTTVPTKPAGETCTVEKAKADYTVQVKLLAADGEVLAESETETVKVNTGFFAKLIAFFKQLFGKLPVLKQTAKKML